MFYRFPVRRSIFGFDGSAHVRRGGNWFFENCYLRPSFNCRHKVGADRQLGIEFPEYVPRGAGSVQQTRALSRAGGVGYSELQSKAVP